MDERWIRLMYTALKALYEDPDAEINGGDLVEAIGFCVAGEWGFGLVALDAMKEEQAR